jgi:adenylate kinase family enzyme
MRKVVVFGNSGSGKSTLAKDYSQKYGLTHLDLDALAWRESDPPTRLPLDESAAEVQRFLDNNDNWVIEGCYSDLLGLAINKAGEVIFLNPGEETCISNCRARPWERHKYESLDEQNKNLSMLLDWVRQYSLRDDEFSLSAHQQLFNDFTGSKTEFKSNERNA